ncbi:DUF4214 domain-containing protein [Asticcacaulis sp. SL142]|uniref:DUF4214 domain-containing protein n=1 Tax=Asticcacaulis sp. SL142 TaxID=2995155 RepID=UPI00226D05CA|nr:DUF4214 domain-containing protein [Asticcacaulis sp. SL142]WAC47068.1 DUF4214 domain-containing protein [Asticcacaulis sp. SL142]
MTIILENDIMLDQISSLNAAFSKREQDLVNDIASLSAERDRLLEQVGANDLRQQLASNDQAFADLTEELERVRSNANEVNAKFHSAQADVSLLIKELQLIKEKEQALIIENRKLERASCEQTQEVKNKLDAYLHDQLSREREINAVILKLHDQYMSYLGFSIGVQSERDAKFGSLIEALRNDIYYKEKKAVESFAERDVWQNKYNELKDIISLQVGQVAEMLNQCKALVEENKSVISDHKLIIETLNCYEDQGGAILEHNKDEDNSKICKNLDELIDLYDQNFISSAYYNLLLRAPDTAGFNYYLNRVRAGYDKRHIVFEMRTSVEGRKAGVELPGLITGRPLWRRIASHLRGFLHAVIGVSAIERQLRRVENQQGRFRNEIIQILTSKQYSKSERFNKEFYSNYKHKDLKYTNLETNKHIDGMEIIGINPHLQEKENEDLLFFELLTKKH